VHSCANLTNEVLKVSKFLVGDPKFGCHCVDSLLSCQELVLQPRAVLDIRVTDEAHVMQQGLACLDRGLGVTRNIVYLSIDECLVSCQPSRRMYYR